METSHGLPIPDAKKGGLPGAGTFPARDVEVLALSEEQVLMLMEAEEWIANNASIPIHLQEGGSLGASTRLQTWCEVNLSKL